MGGLCVSFAGRLRPSFGGEGYKGVEENRQFLQKNSLWPFGVELLVAHMRNIYKNPLSAQDEVLLIWVTPRTSQGGKDRSMAWED